MQQHGRSWIETDCFPDSKRIDLPVYLRVMGFSFTNLVGLVVDESRWLAPLGSSENHFGRTATSFASCWPCLGNCHRDSALLPTFWTAPPCTASLIFRSCLGSASKAGCRGWSPPRSVCWSRSLASEESWWTGTCRGLVASNQPILSSMQCSSRTCSFSRFAGSSFDRPEAWSCHWNWIWKTQGALASLRLWNRSRASACSCCKFVASLRRVRRIRRLL